jgi:hypothetical protein
VNLRRVFTKLGITSRKELGAILADTGPARIAS